VAILADTALRLKRTGAHSLHVLATTHNNIPLSLVRILSNWSLQIAMIEEVDQSRVAYIILSGDIMSSFVLKLETLTIKSSTSGNRYVFFSLVGKSDGTKLLVWNGSANA